MDICVFSKSNPKGAEQMLGPFATDDVLLDLDDLVDMADIWERARFFKSKSEARRNGHGGQIPAGFTEIRKPKRCIRVSIWNPAPEDDEMDADGKEEQ